MRRQDGSAFENGTNVARALAMQAQVSSATIMGRPLGMATAHATGLAGLEPYPIRVEVSCTRGPAFFQLVGLAEAAVREARVRVASALASMGILLDEYAITINLAPAGIRKTGAALDLAIAVGVLGAIGELPPRALGRTLLIGELSLDGTLQPVSGVLPRLCGVRASGLTSVIVPLPNSKEAGLARGVTVHAARALAPVVAHFRGSEPLPRVPATSFRPAADSLAAVDLSEVRGQALARRALEIAAAGNHNLLMIGPPGSGKTLLARSLPSVLPPLSYDEAVEATQIHSVAGLVPLETGIVDQRPFRAPHHTVSEAGLVGGGELPRPGEITLAHHGVLFLDELCEFRRSALEALRQPLEDGVVSIVRARARAIYPARPLVVAAVNPCPCGHLGHPRRTCRCSERARQNYLARLSGPLLDRLDVHVRVPPVEVKALTYQHGAESSAEVRSRVLEARRRQEQRFSKGEVKSRFNAGLSLRELGPTCGGVARHLLETAVERLGLSARAFVKVLRVARTIADLERSPQIAEEHVAEAIQTRLLDPQAPHTGHPEV